MYSNIVDLGNNVYSVDVFDQGMPERTSCYFILAEEAALIETGPSPGAGRLLAAMKSLGLPPEKIKYIIVTHIHLDHSGGAGVMARELPEAQVFVHPRGARHLIDPSRLISGAKAVYGERFEGFFGNILPLPEERIYTPEDGETLDLGGGRTLTFLYAPGHARHHFIIYDPASRGVFSGDALGVRFSALSRLLGRDFTLPSTAPSEFDPVLSVETMKRAAALEIDNIYFAHFGRAAGAKEIIPRNIEMVGVFEDTGRRVLASGGGPGEIEEALWELVMNELNKYGFYDREHPAAKYLSLEMELNAAGIAHYLKKQHAG